MTATRKLDRAKINSDAAKAEEASQNYVQVAVSWQWPGSSRAVKGSLREEIVDGLDAQSEAVSASTRMFQWRQPALARVRQLKREVQAYWHGLTVAWAEEAGARLLPKAKVEEFEARMNAYREQLAGLAAEVQAARAEIIERAKSQRGRAFSEADYPQDLSSLFELSWGYSSLQVSEELKSISATAYAAEKTRQTARLLGAVRMAEEQSVRELHQMAAKLASRLEAADAPLADGEARLPIFASMVESVKEFVARFSGVVCWGCDDLDEIVQEAGGAVEGVSAEDMKADREVRQQVAERLMSAARKLEAIIPELEAERPAGTRLVEAAVA
jgi:hypothetical protein